MHGDPLGLGQHFHPSLLVCLFFTCSFIYWNMYYYLTKFFTSSTCKSLIKTPEVATRVTNNIISSLHSLILIISWIQMVYFSCELPGKTFFNDAQCYNYTSPAMEVFLTVSLGYFVNDCI